MTEATNTTEFVLRDTAELQLRSVQAFMLQLGYTLDFASKTGRFRNIHAPGTGNDYVSYRTAVKLHNSKREDFTVIAGQYLKFNHVEMDTIFTIISLELAIASKLVKTAKIGLTKRGMFVANDPNVHLVKPVNAIVPQMLGL